MELKNPQDILINSLDGIYLVDAGAGTGKTRTIIKRYQKLIENNVMPRDILLITFTNNAANQMKEEVIRKVSGNINITELLNAPIMTFHSYCSRLVKNYGMDSPSYLGMNEYISNNFQVIEDRFFELEVFKRFYTNFSRSVKSKYEIVINSLSNSHEDILKTIKKLCSLGIFPAREGWLKDDKLKLKGNYNEYSEIFDEKNQRAEGARGEIQNELYKLFKSASKKIYLNFINENIFLDKTICPVIKEELFNDDSQEELLDFMREVYFEYLKYMLERNLLNFEFMIMFAYVTLLYNKSVRELSQFDYIMVDEFQDTDELQFKLIMLLAKNENDRANLCVVGDWRQGIYGFRNTTIKNITEFEDNLKLFKKELNSTEERIGYDVNNVQRIIFEDNYRSSDRILNFSRETLFCPGKKGDDIDEEYVDKYFKEPLKPKRELNDLTGIIFYKVDVIKDEIGLILKKISELVCEKKKYKIRIFDKNTGSTLSEEPVRYSDICVLSRNKKFGLELQREALLKGIPMNYEGGLELFATQQGILVLAWFRLILNIYNLQGWIPILEKEGYNYNEVKYYTDKIKKAVAVENKLFSELPDELLNFLNYLRSIKENILFVVEAVFEKYNYNDEYANRIIDTIRSWLLSDSISISDLVYIMGNFKTNEFNLELNETANAVVVHTIHGVKGLEYPVVIVANCNVKTFPSTKGESGSLIYNPVIGLRGKKTYGTNGKYYYRFNNWKTDLLSSMIKSSDYDEERRLLYVASTRAKQYLYFTAYKPSPFFEGLAERTNHKIVDDFEYEIKPLKDEEKSSSVEIKIDKKLYKSKKFISPHKIIDDIDSVETVIDEDDVRSKDFTIKYINEKRKFGIKIHNFAHKIAKGYNVESDFPEVQRIKKFISDLKTKELKSEIEFVLPFKNDVIRGVIDLLIIYDDRIEIIDYKTDSSLNNIEKYKMQLSIYREVIRIIHPEAKIVCKLFFVSLDKLLEIEPPCFEDIYKVKKIY